MDDEPSSGQPDWGDDEWPDSPVDLDEAKQIRVDARFAFGLGLVAFVLVAFSPFVAMLVALPAMSVTAWTRRRARALRTPVAGVSDYAMALGIAALLLGLGLTVWDLLSDAGSVDYMPTPFSDAPG